MHVIYDNELTKQQFVESKGTLARVTGQDIPGSHADFVLLGEIENPAVTLDTHALSRLDNGRLIQGLFGMETIPLTTVYDGLPNSWHHLQGTWPTTLDSLVHIRGQMKSEAFRNAEQILDIACGNGMAGQHAGMNNASIKMVDFSDIENYAVETAHVNRKALGDSLTFGGNMFFGDTYQEVFHLQKGYDVIIAGAIPATPLPPQGIGRAPNPLFEGTEFLEKLLRETPEYLARGGKLILSHSSIGEKAFEEAAAKYGATVDRVLDSRPIAFRTEFLGSQQWTDYLIAEHGLEVREDSDWTYWHSPVVKEISYK